MRLHPRTFPDFPDLPTGCPPLTPTVDPDADTAVRNNLDALPMLDADRLTPLYRVTANPGKDVLTHLDGDSAVLGLEDLLRQRKDGKVALHPHVVQVISVDAADTFLQSVRTLLNIDGDYVSYQYPRYLLECHGIDPARLALYPPDYDIQILDVLSDLRANDILTSVRRPEQAFTDSERVRTAVETAQTQGAFVRGSLTLYQGAEETSPNLYTNAAHELTVEPPTDDQLITHCQSLCNDHDVSLEVRGSPQ